MQNNNFVFIVGVALILSLSIFIYWFWFKKDGPDAKYVVVNNQKWRVEVANTSALRTRGLSYRESLAENSGMLFVFDKPDFYGFWMLGMKFPIDIIFIDENMKIVDIFRDVKPETYPNSFKPSKKSLYVFEVNSGESKNLKIGDIVRLSE